jgi:hypothetical protein
MTSVPSDSVLEVYKRLQLCKKILQKESKLILIIWFVLFRMDKQQFISWTIPWSGSSAPGISAMEPGSSSASWASKQSTGQQPVGPTPLPFWHTAILPAFSAGLLLWILFYEPDCGWQHHYCFHSACWKTCPLMNVSKYGFIQSQKT